MDNNEKLQCHFISNTHWDREWRFSARRTQYMLGYMLDMLLDILDRYPDYRHFHLDSQTMPIQDYLEVYPEKKEKLQKYIQEGRIAVDPKGEVHYMGVYEDDGHYTKFATLGAKKYCYQFEDGKTHCTISGVNKKKGGAELDKHGGIEAFKENFVFAEAGGTESVYNDDADINLLIDGHELHVTANVLIKDSTYTLGITEEYRRIINDANLFAKLLDNGQFS